jgi:hypothetical protein
MNTLEAVQDAQQMWEWKFQNARRECIVLNDGKRSVLHGMLERIFHSLGAKPAVNLGGVEVPVQKCRATV